MSSKDHATKNEGKIGIKGGKEKQLHHRPVAANKKLRKWVPEHKVFDGSIGEGQGFAFKRKQKVQHEYNKLLRKERRKNQEAKTLALYKDEYPEHLRHLYMAEAEKLRNESQINRIKRTHFRMHGNVRLEDAGAEDIVENPPLSDQAASSEPEVNVAVSKEQTEAASASTEPTVVKEPNSVPISNRMKKKMLKTTSYQKTKEEFENVKEKRLKKKEEIQKAKQQKEEAIKKYKQKKMETFQMLSKKTKKGQPNLNLQMDYLLEKIQGSRK
ncbi:thyroid transcription factor 1-associated protein 26 homolog [Aplochiton taeniatus]